MIKIIVDVSPMSHRYRTLMKLLDEDHYIYTKSIGQSELNELTDLTARQLVYNFAEDIQKQFNKEFTEQAIILDKYMSKCHELEQKLSACETVLEDTQQDFDKVLKILKSMTLSMSAHPDCVKGSEFFDLVSIAEKVLECTLDTRHG